jgi:hypothetical protein
VTDPRTLAQIRALPAWKRAYDGYVLNAFAADSRRDWSGGMLVSDLHHAAISYADDLWRDFE